MPYAHASLSDSRHHEAFEVLAILIAAAPRVVTKVEAVGLDVGTIEVGKLADMVIVDGNPLENVANAHKVKRVIANGRVYQLEQLARGNLPSKESTSVSR